MYNFLCVAGCTNFGSPPQEFNIDLNFLDFKARMHHILKAIIVVIGFNMDMDHGSGASVVGPSMVANSSAYITFGLIIIVADRFISYLKIDVFSG
ncbi:hypothetical protein M8C21_004798, partial [Ambrosia artemisiifolia]